MATVGEWVQGARPRTLPAAISPVLIGTAVAWTYLHAAPASPAGHTSISALDIIARALLALVVALALQVGVNYANDYSDGVRGTDAIRVGPVRLVGQGLASPGSVKSAAFASFAIAAMAGLALVLITAAWWLILVGIAAIVAAWFYTGGPRPYGYSGLGEVFVFVFFGLVAVAGSTYVHTLTITWRSIGAGVASGSLAVAILLANNLRDIPTDVVAGKKTLAVRLGDPRTRVAYSIALAIPYVIAVAIAMSGTPWALLAFASAPLTLSPLRQVRGGAVGRGLIPVLVSTGALLLGYAVSLSLGLVISAV